MGQALTPTSYAILGLLAVRPWTTYELAGQMERAVGQFWPRATSKLYEEPKKLVALGLATAAPEAVGRRPRTVYTITDAGLEALAAWMPEPAAPPALEFEGLLKVFFAEHAGRDDLLATIVRARDWTDERAVVGAAIARGYLDGEGPFPERLAWILLAGEFLQRFVRMVREWADWAGATVEEWPDDVRRAAPDWPTLEAMAAENERWVEEAGRRPGAAS